MNPEGFPPILGSCFSMSASSSPSTEFPARSFSELPIHQRKNSQTPLDLFRPHASGSDYPPVFVLCHPSTQKLAEKIVENANFEEGPGRTCTSSSTAEGAKSIVVTKHRRVVLKTDIKWECFRDGWPNIFIENVEEIAGRDVIFVASLHLPNSTLFEQLSVMYMLPRYFIRSFRVILPFFPTGTMERIDHEGQIVTATTLAHMLSVIPMAARGPTQIVMFDIHALQERFYFSHQVIPRLLSAVPLLIEVLQKLPQRNKIKIAFPDEGAYKRFHMLFPPEWPTITCHKRRNGDKREVQIKEGDPSGAYVVVVDDLIQTGGTMMECVKVCEAMGAAAVSAFVTHAVFPQESWRRFTHEGNPPVLMDRFWISDSIPHSYLIKQHKPFEVISISDAIVSSLLSYDLLGDTQ